MSLLDGIRSELPYMRAQAESLMLDFGTAERATGGTVYDPGTQTEGPAYDALFSSACRLKARSAIAEQVGARTAVTVRLELHLPADSDPLAVGDVWEFTATDDLSLATVGERYVVTEPFTQTLATARRYEVERSVS